VFTRTCSALAALLVATAGLAACSSRPPQRSTASLTRAYLGIATPANRVLEKSFDALEDEDDDLDASAALLRTIAMTERAFDRDLFALKLPARFGGTARALVHANEARADLTELAMSATTVASLDTYEVGMDAMNPPVEVQVRALRSALGLPPPDTD